MPPEVLAWALLFVAGTGAVYRFGSWLLRRSEARQSSAIAVPSAVYAPPPETPAPLAISSPPFRTPVARVRPAAALPSVPESVPPLEPARHDPVPVAVDPAATVAAGVAPPLRPALKPSIAATLPPKPSAAPAALAVSSPPFRTPVAGVRQADAPPSAPANVPAPAPAAHYAAPVETAAPPSPAPPSEPAVTEAPLARRKLVQPALTLRAWKLGEVAPRLDIRLKETRSRKVITIAKALRKPSEKQGPRGLKVLSPRSAPEKSPVRRIGRKLDAATLLASMPVQTRVVGVRTRRFRVLSVTEL